MDADGTMTNEEINELRQQLEHAEAEFAAACRKLSEAQKAVHAARNCQKVARRHYIEAIEERGLP